MTFSNEGTDGGDAGPPDPARILVVDDEESIRTLLKQILTDEGHEVDTADDGAEAVQLLEEERFALVVTDLVMPGLNGVEVLRAAHRIDPNYPVAIITGYPSVESVVRLVQLGAVDYITKPFSVDGVKFTIAKLLAMKRMREQAALARIHRRTSFGTALEEASGCPSESGVMVLEQKPARKQGAPNRCCHRTNPTVSGSSLTTIAWWPMPACSCRPP